MRNKILSNYLSTILLLSGVVVGGLLGVFLGPKAAVLRPIGEIFLNLIFVLVVPLVFLSVAQSMIVLRRNNMVGKVLGTAIVVFLCMSTLAALASYLGLMAWNPFTELGGIGLVEKTEVAGSSSGIWESLPGAVTVGDFPLLLSKSNLLPLIVFSALFGVAVSMLGEKGSLVAKFIEECSLVIMKIMELVMKIAPLGIGCYFADVIGNLGGQIVGSYLDIFLVVLVVSLVFYFGVNTVYALIAGVPLGVFWREMIAPSVTAIGTCSSAACMPVSIKAASNMGVDPRIAEGVIPLGTNLHKDGSIITSVGKILFAMTFFGMYSPGIGTLAMVVGIALIQSVVVGAIPIGGMTGEILICSILGVDPSFAATILIIGTICDIPATLLNSTMNLSGAMLVDRFCYGRSLSGRETHGMQ